MTPRRPMLEQDGGASVRARRAQQQSRRAVQTPEVRAIRRTDPAVTVTAHDPRIGNPRGTWVWAWVWAWVWELSSASRPLLLEFLYS